ncbi:MAG: GTP 3',8-cyclase MoaA [Thermoguttaceae bacterium]
MKPLLGAARRPVYLRLSVTDRCNLRCRYCRPARSNATSSPVASDEELLGLIALLHEEFPIYKVRITGGEPLLRAGLPGLIEKLRQQMPSAELGMTTNAVLLKQHAVAVRRAGVEFLNTSLDTLSAELCKELTRGGDVRSIVDGIRAAHAAGFRQIRINTVLMRTFNGDSLPSLVRFAAELGCEIRFIELMPFGEGAAIYDKEFLSADEALDSLEAEFANLGPLPRSSTARRHRLSVDGREQAIGFITNISHPFCDGCDRTRLDSRGRLYACLRTVHGVDLLTPCRAGRIEMVRSRIRGEVPNKTIPQGVWPTHNMVSIGG